jgi:hypothetical protein
MRSVGHLVLSRVAKTRKLHGARERGICRILEGILVGGGLKVKSICTCRWESFEVVRRVKLTQDHNCTINEAHMNEMYWYNRL